MIADAGLDDGLADDLVAESYTERVAEQVTASAAQRDLAEALAQLSPQDREVLLMIAWADLSYEEAARALGIPIGTVRSRLHPGQAAQAAHRPGRAPRARHR